MLIRVLNAVPLVLASLLAGAAASPPWVDRSGHSTRRIAVAPGVSVEVLDWGGQGPPILLLAGLGNTAHVFDHFAHQFTDGHHVFAMTRRGYGQSSHVASGYDPLTRANDLFAVVERLQLDRVILIGHSIAGDELTMFAELHPDRVSALVYIDAAYDRTQVADLPQPSYPMPRPNTYDSVENYTAYMARVWNWRAPDAETYNTRTVTQTGRVGKPRTSPAITEAIVSRLTAPDYTRVQASALALYALPSVVTAYAYFADLDAESQRRAERIVQATVDYQAQAIAAFRSDRPNREVAILGGNHYLFLTNESEVVRLINAFLSKVGQAATR